MLVLCSCARLDFQLFYNTCPVGMQTSIWMRFGSHLHFLLQTFDGCLTVFIAVLLTHHMTPALDGPACVSDLYCWAPDFDMGCGYEKWVFHWRQSYK